MQGDYSALTNEYFVRRFRELATRRAARIRSLDTPEKVAEYAAEVRSKIRQVFDLDGRPRTPLNLRCTGERDYRSYRLKRMIFESVPGYYVTGDLYLPPAEEEKKFPCVLHLCGHNEDGKSCANGVSLNVGFAANGIAVFAIDPVGQGERYQHFFEHEEELCTVHNILGKEMLLYGDHFGAWRAWDVVRALDCLDNMPEIDSAKLMLTGCSGGGTMTCWVNALEDRLIAAAPSCAATRWFRTVENEMPIDAEQLPPKLAGMGLDMADFLIASLPRPVLVSGEAEDFFDERGQKEVGTELEHLSGIMRSPLPCQTFTGPHSHGLKFEQREAIRAFFFKAAGVTFRGIAEDAIPRPAAEEKLAAPGGDVFNLPGNLPAMELMKQRCAAVTAARPHLAGASLKAALSKVLGIQIDIPAPENYRIAAVVTCGKIRLNRYVLENSERILGVLHMAAGEGETQIPRMEKALLYLPETESSEVAALPPDRSEGRRIFTLDTFGIGELKLTTGFADNRSMTAPYGAYWHAAGLSLMLGTTFPGLQVEGILAAIRLLQLKGVRDLWLAGRHTSAPLAAYAGILAGEPVRGLILQEAPVSFESMVGTASNWPFCALVPGLLTVADLPEILEKQNVTYIK